MDTHVIIPSDTSHITGEMVTEGHLWGMLHVKGGGGDDGIVLPLAVHVVVVMKTSIIITIFRNQQHISIPCYNCRQKEKKTFNNVNAIFINQI